MRRCIVSLLVLLSVSILSAQTELDNCRQDNIFLSRSNKELQIQIDELIRRNTVLERNLRMFQESNADRINHNRPAPNSDSKIIPGHSNNRRKPNKPSNNYNPQQDGAATTDLKEREKIVEIKEEIRGSLAISTSNIAKKVSLFNNHFDTYIIQLNATKQNVEFLWKDQEGFNYGSLQRVREETINKEVVFSTNGGMYSPDLSPQGLLIQNGVKTNNLEVDISKGKRGNFYLQPNGVFLLDKQNRAKILTTEVYMRSNIEKDVAQATQSGPMLVIGGRYHPAFIKGSDNKKIRSGVGIIDENTVVFAISKLGVNFYDFARLFKDVYGCEDALFLDGSVSQMYCPELGRYDVGGEFGTIINLVK